MGSRSRPHDDQARFERVVEVQTMTKRITALKAMGISPGGAFCICTDPFCEVGGRGRAVF